MKVLLDTNFIITCVKNKIDFPSRSEEIIDESIEWLIPQDVLNELGNLKDKKGAKVADRSAAELSFEIIKSLDPEVLDLPGKNPNVDIKIVNYILDKPIVLATLDKNLKFRVSNKILTTRGKKGLELL